MFTQQTTQFKQLSLKFKYELKDQKSLYVTKCYEVTNSTQSPQPIVYVIELNDSAVDKVQHHKFVAFKQEKSHQGHYLILNFQCQVQQKISLPTGFHCYVSAQSQPIEIIGHHEFFTETQATVLLPSNPQPPTSQKIIATTTSQTTSEPIFTTSQSSVESDSPTILFGINLNELDKLAIQPSSPPKRKQVIREEEAKRHKLETQITMDVDTQITAEAAPMGATQTSKRKTENQGRRDKYKKTEQMVSSEPTKIDQSDVQRDAEYRAAAITAHAKGKQQQFNSLLDFTWHFCHSETNLAANIEIYFDQAKKYRKDTSHIGILEYFLTLLTKNNRDKSWIKTDKDKKILATFVNVCIHHCLSAPVKKLAAEYCSLTIHRLGVLAKNHSLQTKDLDANGLINLIQHLSRLKIAEIGISCILWGLGRLGEAGMKFPNDLAPDIVSIVLQLLKADPEPQHISNGLWGLGRLAEAGMAFPEDLALSLAPLLQQLMKTHPGAQPIANSLWGLGRLAEAGMKFPKDLALSIAPLVQQLVKENPNEQEIANSLWGLGRLAEAGVKFPNDLAPSITRLVQQLVKVNPREQAIANSLWGLGRLAEAGMKFPNDLAPSITQLIQQLMKARPKAQNLANSLWGLGRLAEAGMKFPKDLATSIAPVVQLLLKENPNTQEIANSLWGLGRLAEAGVRFPKDLAPSITLLVQRLMKANPKAQEIANSLWGLGRLAEAGMKFPDDLAPSITLLVQRLMKANTESQHIANSLWGLGRLAEAGMKFPDDLAPSITQLVQQLTKAHPETQAIGNSLWGLGRLAEAGMKFPNELAPSITSLVQQLLKANPTAQEIANSLWGLGRLAEAGMKFPKDLAPCIAPLVQQLLKASPTAQVIANSLWGLGRLAEAGMKFPDDVATSIAPLVQQLLKANPESQHIANSLWGLGRLAEAGMKFPDDLAPSITPLVQQLMKANPKAQEISNSLWGLGRLAEAGMKLPDDLAPSISPLVQQLLKANPDAQAIANSLWGLGRLAEAGMKFPDDLMRCITEAYQRLIEFNPESHNICASIGAISDLTLAGFNTKDDKLRAAITLLIQQFDKMDKNSLSISLVLNYLGKMASHPGSFVNHMISVESICAWLPRANYKALEGVYSLATFWQRESITTIQNIHLKNAMTEYLKRYNHSLCHNRTDRISARINNLYKATALIYIFDISMPEIKELSQLIQACLKRRLSHYHYVKLHKVLTHLSSKIDDALIKQFEMQIHKKLARFNTQQKTALTIKNDSSANKAEVTDAPSSAIALTPAQLKMTTYPTPTIAAKPRDIKQFDIHNQSDIKQLETHIQKTQGTPFTYLDTNKKRRRKFKLFIAPLAILGGQHALFSNEDISVKDVNEIMGIYAGQTKEVNLTGEREDPNETGYYFQIEQPDGQLIVVDAKYQGDWTRAINGSQVCNVTVKEETRQGQTQVFFRVAKAVRKGRQLLFDYGPHYFSNVDYVPFYLHESDNWETKEERYQRLRTDYSTALCTFDLQTKADLKLAGDLFLVPIIFHDISRNDVGALTIKLAALKTRGVDIEHLLVYGCDDQGKTLLPYQQQQHLTPLMYACYLGQEACIEALINAGADIDRAQLVAGGHALNLLLQGRGENALVEKMALRLLDELQQSFMLTPFTTDADDLGILHYAMKRKLPKVIEKIISIADPKEVLRLMYDRDDDKPAHIDIDDCIREGQFDVIACLFKHLPVALLDEYLNEGWILREEFLATLSQPTLQRLSQCLSDSRLTRSDLFKRVDAQRQKVMSMSVSQHPSTLYANSHPSGESVSKLPPSELKF